MESIEESGNASSGTLAGSLIKTYLIGIYLIAFAAASLLISACGTFQVSFDAREPEVLRPPQIESPPMTPGPQPTQLPVVGSDGNGPFYIGGVFNPGGAEGTTLLQVAQGVADFGPSPVEMDFMWDYSGPSGRIAYASEFYHASRRFSRSVTDLWVYDYASGVSELWLPDDVGRAYWSPYLPESSQPQQLAAAVFDADLGAFDLVIVSGPGQTRKLATCTSGEFSFSPDGARIAYRSGWYNDTQPRPQECEGVFIVKVEDGSARRLTGTDPLATGGWYGDQPIWAESLDALLLKSFNEDSIFNIVPLEGPEWQPVSISASIEEEYLPTPLLSLWSDPHRTVIGQTEGQMDPHAVWVYQFSTDGSQIEKAFRVDWGEYRHDLLLLGWWEPGESVLIRDISNTSELNPLGEVVVWSLAEHRAEAIISDQPAFSINLYPVDITTGIPALDSVLEALLYGDTYRRAVYVKFIEAACTTEDFVVGPPPCEDGMPAGTIVERFPYRQYREQRYAERGDIARLMDFEIAGLYAIASNTEAGPGGGSGPAASYRIALVSTDEQKLIDVLVDGDGVVEIDFWELTPPEVYSNSRGPWLLPPL